MAVQVELLVLPQRPLSLEALIQEQAVAMEGLAVKELIMAVAAVAQAVIAALEELGK